MQHPLEQDLDHVLAHTEPLWQSLRGERLFITGGTGFVGTWLAESFVWANGKLNLGAHAVLLTRNPDAFRRRAPHVTNHPSIELLRGDANSFLYPAGRFSFVIHGATEQHAPSTDEQPTSTFLTDLDATRRVLEFARISGTTRFLFTSSGAAYGKQPPELSNMPEDYPGAPLTTDLNAVYGQAKHASEFVCAMYARQFGFAAILARLFAFAGPLLPLHLNFAVGNFVRDVLRREPVRIGGDGTPCRSYLYAADLAIWLWTLLIRGQSCRLYNVGSTRALSITELAHLVVANTAPGTAVEIARQPVPGALASRYVPCVRRVREEFGLEEIFPLEEQIRRMYAWNRDHPSNTPL